MLGNDIYQPEPIEVKKMKDWLFKSYQDEGFKNYYTMRKKYLMNLLALGLEGKEQSKTLGRLEELKGLATNINQEFKNRKIQDKTKH
jgi:hypothetical protein